MYQQELISWKIVLVALALATIFVGVLDNVH